MIRSRKFPYSLLTFTANRLGLKATHAWTKIKSKNAPSARYEHAMVADPTANKLYVLFGAEPERNLNDVHVYDIGMVFVAHRKNNVDSVDDVNTAFLSGSEFVP